MTDHQIGTREEWLAARKALLESEKEYTRRGDELARQRRELPWVRVEKEYSFDTDEGTKTLPELFDGRSQLLFYHFMFGPDYELGCPTCSSMADGLQGAVVHLRARDVTMLFASRAPLDKLQAYKRRMGWSIGWVSTADSDFNFDYGVSFTEQEQREGAEYNYRTLSMAPILDGPPMSPFDHLAETTGTDIPGYLSEGPGFSAFALSGGDVYHTYSCYARGLEFLMGFYGILDRAPKGRDEREGEFWIRRNDEYAEGETA